MINAGLGEVPELEMVKPHLYEYPSTGTHWIWPTHKVGMDPAYLVVKNIEGEDVNGRIHKNHVHGNGEYAYGHYHLMTRDAWKLLNKQYPAHVGLVKRILSQRASAKLRNYNIKLPSSQND